MTDGSRLVMKVGPQPGQTFLLDQELLTLGRDPSSEIVINDPQVSRQHARIKCQGNLTVIEDVGSTNGTFVNGMRLTGPHTLADGDTISLGDAVSLTYHAGGIATTEPLGGRPTAIQAPSTYVPQPEPPPPYSPAPSPAEPQVDETPGKTWLLVGCVSLVLLGVVACAGVFVLDYLSLLPAFFYEPLRWLGLI
jgi:predicted component of type VI protein secretion system